MCGIAGFYGATSVATERHLVEMTDVLVRRGPDAKGYYFNPPAALGHRRLSIVDLSSSSNQPFTSNSGRYIIVFNGEVYNYKELATHIDVPLRTTGDTEVLVELFAKHGPEFVSMLNGMFAFVIYDIQEKGVHVFRDRLGVKPLFYSWDGGLFVFSSELKSFNVLSFVEKKINKRALFDFLQVGYIPEPDSIYEAIHKFPAGAYASVKGSDFTVKKYWNVQDKISPDVKGNYEDAKAELKSLLESSVRYRMISDVPSGTFLSGGIDSSLVSAIASRETSSPLKTFSIGFKESAFDESVYAQKVATYLGADHHQFVVTEKEALEYFETILDNFDEPFADTSALPTYLVSKLASNHVKMILTGDGGDELFMGYGSYRWAQRFSNPLVNVVKGPASFLLKNFGDSRLKRIGHMFSPVPSTELQKHIFSQEQYLFSRKEVEGILTNEFYEKSKNGIQPHHSSKRVLSAPEQQSLYDIQHYLKDDLLVKVDRTSMYSSIEAREPLLDYRLVEFAINLSENFKWDKNQSKRILKEVLYSYVPKEYFERPKKGFSIPLATWLKSELKYLMEDYLSENKIKELGIFKVEGVKELVRKFHRGDDFLYNRIFAIIIVQRWFSKNKHS